LTAITERLPGWFTRRTGNLIGFLWCVALMAYALFVQYRLHDDPCPLCILQRIAVIAAGVVFLVACLHDAGRIGGRVYALLIWIVVLIGAGIAARHVWIIAQPPGTVSECGASLDYMMDVLPLREVLAKVLSGSGECAKVAWRFLGLSMPAWVIVNLVAMGMLGTLANVCARRTKPVVSGQ
jgi:disulfide bond formation protein DsbB